MIPSKKLYQPHISHCAALQRQATVGRCCQPVSTANRPVSYIVQQHLPATAVQSTSHLQHAQQARTLEEQQQQQRVSSTAHPQQPQQQQQQLLEPLQPSAADIAAYQQADPQQLQYLQDAQQYWQQSADSTSSSSSIGSGLTLVDSSSSSGRRSKARNPLGGAYAPGDVWHIRRRQPALPFSVESVFTAAAPADAAEQQQQLGLSVTEDIDFVLLDRLNSNSSASSSGRQHSSFAVTASSSTNSMQDSGAAGMQQQQSQQQQQQQQQAVGVEGRRTPAANFRDAAFEQALSRWMKEAPDWFKIRSVYERYPKRFNIVHVACALSCLADKTAAQLAAKRPSKPELTALRAFVDQLLAAASEQLPSIDAATAAALLHSLARLAATRQVPAAHASELVDALLIHTQPYLHSLTPSQLTQTVWALKQLQHSPSEAWCESLYGQTQGLVTQLNGFEAALLLRGLAVVKAPVPPPGWSSAVLGHTEGQLEGMEPKHISLLLLGLGGLKVQPSRTWLSAATAAMRSKFDQMGPQALSNVMWAFVKLGVLPDRAWLTAYFNTSLQLLDSLNRQELSMDMWALSKLRLEPGDLWLDEYFDATEAQLTRFTLRDLAIVGFALAKLGLRPPSTWLRRYCALLLKHKAGLCRNKALLSQVMVALDSFKVPRMDMWRREMYAAAGYKLYKYPNWRERVRVQAGFLGPGAGFGRRLNRLSRRGSRVALMGSSSGRLPQVMRSGDWGVMDAGGVLGASMSSYEELGVAVPAAGQGAAAAGTVKRTLPSTGLVRPQRPSSAGSSGSSSSSGAADATSGTPMGSVWDGGW